MKISENKAFLALLTRAKGATSNELREAMGRKMAPAYHQLQPIADRLGYELSWTKPEGENTHWHFKALKPASKAKGKGKRAANSNAEKAAA